MADAAGGGDDAGFALAEGVAADAVALGIGEALGVVEALDGSAEAVLADGVIGAELCFYAGVVARGDDGYILAEGILLESSVATYLLETGSRYTLFLLRFSWSCSAPDLQQSRA